MNDEIFLTPVHLDYKLCLLPNRSVEMAEKERYTVMVVDDTEANIDILVEILDADYDISVAMDGETALETAGEDPPDLILLDIMMPEMDGYEVCRRLKAEEGTKDIPVVFVTAKEEIEDKLKGYDLGATDYLTKPIDPGLVLSLLKKYLK
jgi:putative two-component system response regulator